MRREGFELNALKGMKDTPAIHALKFHSKSHSQMSKDRNARSFENLGYDSFRKIERGFPDYDSKENTRQEEDYFYLHATSSLAT